MVPTPIPEQFAHDCRAFLFPARKAEEAQAAAAQAGSYLLCVDITSFLLTVNANSKLRVLDLAQALEQQYEASLHAQAELRAVF